LLDVDEDDHPVNRVMRTPVGVRLADLGELWSAFSPLSGQTVLLNTEAVAILELLRESPGNLAQVCQTLAMDTGLAADEMQQRCSGVWQELLDAGLLEAAGARPTSASA
jgi:PqqD family protein of HPr-rel-A system